MNIWTRGRQQNGTGRSAIVTQRIRVQHGKSDKEHLLTWPDCLSVFDEDELKDIVDDLMIRAAQKVQQGADLTGDERRRYIGGMLVHAPGFWQRVKARITR